MKNFKQITLLIVIHSQFSSIDFFLSLINNSAKNFDVIFAFDKNESEIPKQKIDEIRNENFTVIFNEENIGKLATVIKASSQIKTPFFKIIDQDDSVDLTEISELNAELENVNVNSLVKHKAAKIYKKNISIYFQTDDEFIIKKQVSIGKDVHWAQQVNCDTIYPTSIIRKMNKIKFTRQHFHNDVLLSNFCIGMGSKLEKINSKFYIHFHNAGQTSQYNVKRAECIVELYENYLLIKNTYSEFNFKKLMLGMKISHVFFAKSFTKWYLKKDNPVLGRKLYKESLRLIKKNSSFKK